MAHFEVPGSKDTTVTGDCKLAFIQLAWIPVNGDNSWSVRFDFTQDTDKNNYVKNITLNYEMTEKLFPNTNTTGKMGKSKTLSMVFLVKL